jgi:hypothetical protein
MASKSIKKRIRIKRVRDPRTGHLRSTEVEYWRARYRDEAGKEHARHFDREKELPPYPGRKCRWPLCHRNVRHGPAEASTSMVASSHGRELPTCRRNPGGKPSQTGPRQACRQPLPLGTVHQLAGIQTRTAGAAARGFRPTCLSVTASVNWLGACLCPGASQDFPGSVGLISQV